MNKMPLSATQICRPFSNVTLHQVMIKLYFFRTFNHSTKNAQKWPFPLVTKICNVSFFFKQFLQRTGILSKFHLSKLV